MARRKGNNPTDRELEILRILWTYGSCSVRRVNEFVCQESDTGYTTTLKFMQIMLEKGLVTRDTSQRTHIYSAAAEEANVQKALAADLVDKAFGGSAQKLVMQALQEKQVPQNELIRIQRMLDELEGEENDVTSRNS
ncbi:MAG: BlaI/MecI/CopY family transcriptional regulator [Planctomycetes bacterium]|nr:BlaI/MecI/CopY family transcriptional regulator [Planctomycetota bacterium]